MQQPAFEPGPETPGTALDTAPSTVRLVSIIDDWDCMFHAVLHRLRRLGGSDPRTEDEAPANLALDRLAVLDCVAALEQLHDALTDERLQRRWHGVAAG